MYARIPCRCWGLLARASCDAVRRAAPVSGGFGSGGTLHDLIFSFSHMNTADWLPYLLVHRSKLALTELRTRGCKVLVLLEGWGRSSRHPSMWMMGTTEKGITHSSLSPSPYLTACRRGRNPIRQRTGQCRASRDTNKPGQCRASRDTNKPAAGRRPVVLARVCLCVRSKRCPCASACACRARIERRAHVFASTCAPARARCVVCVCVCACARARACVRPPSLGKGGYAVLKVLRQSGLSCSSFSAA